MCLCVCVCLCVGEKKTEKMNPSEKRDISLKAEGKSVKKKKGQGEKEKRGDGEKKKERCRKGFCNLGIEVLCRLHGDRHKGLWLAIDG